MNKIYKKSLFLLLLLPALNYAQVGISNSAPKAQLDISASNQASPASTDGILIPRLNAFPGTNPGADQNAMLVYLNVASGANPIGFYYWNNATTAWLPFGGGTTNGWDLLGNAGTVNGTNFLGTTDAQAVDIRTNNVIHARITTKGQIEILNTGRSVFIGEGAGANDDLTNNDNVFVGNNAGTATTTGPANVAIGPNALAANTTGAGSVAIGNSTLAAATTSPNIAIGNSALGFGTTPSNSVGIGTSALLNSNGNFNTGIGHFSLSNNFTSSNNTGLGFQSGVNYSGDNNVALGFQADQFNQGGAQNVVVGARAGYVGGSGNNNDGNVLIGYSAAQNIATSNSLYIENSSSVTPLVYGEFDNNIVRIGGQLQVGSSDNATVGSIYAFPTVDGTVGQALITDGGGNVSWGTVTGGGADTQDLSIVDGTGTISLVDGGSVNVSTIADADADTKIQVEESADEDVIRFDVEGTEHFRMDTKGRLEVLNTGNSVFIGEGAGAADNLSDNRSIFIGKDAGMSVGNRLWNIGIGYEALKSATGGIASNIAIGYQSQVNTTTSSNVTMGRWTLRSNTFGGQNVSIGTSSGGYVRGRRNVSVGEGSLNQSNGGAELVENVTAVGYQALSSFNNGGENVGVGNNALNSFRSGSDMTAIGGDAGVRVSLLGTSSNSIFVGAFSGGDTEAPISTPQTNYTNSMIIGGHAGEFDRRAAISDRLIIEPSASNTPLIGGDFANDRVGININMSTAGTGVGVGPAALTHTLTVGGDVFASGDFVTPTNTYPDYVFEDYFTGNSLINKDYKFMTLNEAIRFVEKNGHLPNVKSYKEVEAEDMQIDLGATSIKNLEKIEENFLYIKEINEKNEALEKENKELKALLNNVIERLEKLESK